MQLMSMSGSIQMPPMFYSRATQSGIQSQLIYDSVATQVHLRCNLGVNQVQLMCYSAATQSGTQLQLIGSSVQLMWNLDATE